jgi:hypothetical protein
VNSKYSDAVAPVVGVVVDIEFVVDVVDTGSVVVSYIAVVQVPGEAHVASAV